MDSPACTVGRWGGKNHNIFLFTWNMFCIEFCTILTNYVWKSLNSSRTVCVGGFGTIINKTWITSCNILLSPEWQPHADRGWWSFLSNNKWNFSFCVNQIPNWLAILMAHKMMWLHEPRYSCMDFTLSLWFRLGWPSASYHEYKKLANKQTA